MKNHTKVLVGKALKHYSSKELQKLLGATQCTISHWKTGKADMSYSRGKELEKILSKSDFYSGWLL